MSDSSYVGDYFYANEEGIKYRRVTHLLPEVWPAPASYSSHTVA